VAAGLRSFNVSAGGPAAGPDSDCDWIAMNGPDHYRAAERLVEEAASREEPDPRASWCLELAKVLAPVQVVPPWTGPALRGYMAAITKRGQARSAKSQCPRFEGNRA
jgi:hypothetical protein